MKRKLLSMLLAIAMVFSVVGIMGVAPVMASEPTELGFRFFSVSPRAPITGIDAGFTGQFVVEFGATSSVGLPVWAIDGSMRWNSDALTIVSAELAGGRLNEPMFDNVGTNADETLGRVGVGFVSLTAPVFNIPDDGTWQTFAIVTFELASGATPENLEFTFVPADGMPIGFVTTGGTQVVADVSLPDPAEHVFTIANPITGANVIGDTALFVGDSYIEGTTNVPVPGVDDTTTITINPTPADFFPADTAWYVQATGTFAGLLDVARVGTTNDFTFSVASGAVIPEGVTRNIPIQVRVPGVTAAVATFNITITNTDAGMASDFVEFQTRYIGDDQGDDTTILDANEGDTVVVGRQYRVAVITPFPDTGWFAIPMQFDPDQIRIDEINWIGAPGWQPLDVGISAELAAYTVGTGTPNVDRVNDAGHFLLGAARDNTNVGGLDEWPALPTTPMFEIIYTVLAPGSGTIDLGLGNVPAFGVDYATPIRTQRPDHPMGAWTRVPVGIEVGYEGRLPLPIEEEAVEITIVYAASVWTHVNGDLVDGTLVRFPHSGGNAIYFRAEVTYADGPNYGYPATNQNVTWDSAGVAGPIGTDGRWPQSLNAYGDLTVTAASTSPGLDGDPATTTATVEIVILEFVTYTTLGEPTGAPVELDIDDTYDLTLFFGANVETLAEGVEWVVESLAIDGVTWVTVTNRAAYLNINGLDVTFNAYSIGTHRVRAISEEHPQIYAYVVFFVSGTATITGRAMLSGKERVTSMYGWNPHNMMDFGIRVQLVELDANGRDLAAHVTTYTGMHTAGNLGGMPGGPDIADDCNVYFNYTLNIPVDLMARIVEARDVDESRFIIRFTRVGDRGQGGVAIRRESYLVAEITLYASDDTRPNINMVIPHTTWLVAGAFTTPTPDKRTITLADVNTIRTQVGNGDENCILVQHFNINEYLGVDGADFSTVLGFLDFSADTGWVDLYDGSFCLMSFIPWAGAHCDC